MNDSSYLLLSSSAEGRLIHQAADPGAATPLHDRFAAGLRVLLRHKLPSVDVETGVFYVLVTVARAIREGNIQSEADLPAQVRLAANGFIKEASSTRPAAHPGIADHLRRILKKMDPIEREILIRFYRLGQTEQDICHAMNVSPEAVRKAKHDTRSKVFAKKAASSAEK